jgi:hypothetical protein
MKLQRTIADVVSMMTGIPWIVLHKQKAIN